MTQNQAMAFATDIHKRIEGMEDDRERMAYLMRLLWHSPYTWGGESITGADCSGSISFAGYLLGYNLRVTADSYDKMFTDPLDGGIPTAGDVCVWYHENKNKARHIAMFSDHLLIMDADKQFLDTPITEEILDRPDQKFNFKRLNLDKMKAASDTGSYVFGLDEDLKAMFGIFRVEA